MHLKELEVQGYKTFASKTHFLFNGGLTAIVGPNGSGKSNVADAIQWVLGEQSYGLLRAKRSEDMIFSGSNERARMGMAQATLTLDNTDGWLPIDYGEVVLTRRAFRSGENEYYLNGSRVRLRDITDLLSQSGLGKRTYTVVGQGMVDQALSLRPDERRALIEEAAGISGHQSQRNTALRQLEETRHNLERVRDILGEIEPRLRYLKGQATRAEQRLQVQADLDSHLRIWYGYRWHQALADLQEARARELDANAAVAARQKTVEEVTAAMARLREQHVMVRNRLGDWHRDSSRLHRQAETAQRELAVGDERLSQLGQRREEVQTELEPLQARLAAQEEQVRSAQAALDQEQLALQAVQEALKQAQARVDSLQVERSRHHKVVAKAERLIAELQGEQDAQERRLLEQRSRQQLLTEEEERLRAQLAEVEARQLDLAPQVVQVEQAVASLGAEIQDLSSRRQALHQNQQEVEHALGAEEDQLAGQRRAADRLQDQLELLQRLKEEGEGFSGGTRSVVRALQSGERSLTGIIGPVADQLQVPAHLELAVETALGGRLQDVIVQRWQDAERAIAWLKQTQGGRATFLPLDTLRPASRLSVPRMPGVIGVAADLVSADRRLAPVVDYLLGRVVVTEDLPTARRLVDAAAERPTVVTLEGDIVRPGGSVSGGSQARRRDQGVLARERALRELPQQLQVAQQAMTATQDSIAMRRRSLQEQGQQLARLDQALGDLARDRQSAGARLAGLQGQVDQIQQDLVGRRQRQSAIAQEQARITDRLEQVAQRLAQLADEAKGAEHGRAEAQTAADRLDLSELTAQLAEQRTTAGIMGARVASQQSLLANQQRVLTQIQRELQHKLQRAEALAAERESLAARLEQMRAGQSGLSAEIERFAQLIEPAEAQLAQLEVEQNRLAEEEAAQRRSMQHEERNLTQAQLALQRARDELSHLRGEIEHDVGLVELEQSDLLTDQPPLPLRPVVERLQVVNELPQGLEREIRNLRAQYSRLGSVNPNAPEEYAAALERHEFLTTQSNDLDEAAGALRRVIAELDEVMQRQFMVTFQAVAREFKQKFTSLFGGGTARLELSDPDNALESGIEILVRPPGKRTQPLPLLSGGERSLTAAALILSILQVSPPPFCILDEVDAALDEANVDRFRAALREAAQRTQFVVITHNRGTIEAADTIYGISMGSDSASQVLSLQLEEQGGQRELVPR